MERDETSHLSDADIVRGIELRDRAVHLARETRAITWSSEANLESQAPS